MKNLELLGGGGGGYSLRNICLYDANVVDLMDATEDSNTAEEFEQNISKLHIRGTFKIDRVRPQYVRLKNVDPLGNIWYLQAEF